MARERLPDRRASENFNFTWNRIPFTATISRYPDGRLGEIFLASNKAGSQLDAAARDSAVTCSIALQFGAPVDNIRTALLREANGTPCSPLAAALDEIGKQKP
jgi:ribonucleoside-diphosphate reductase alpha chain